MLCARRFLSNLLQRENLAATFFLFYIISAQLNCGKTLLNLHRFASFLVKRVTIIYDAHILF